MKKMFGVLLITGLICVSLSGCENAINTKVDNDDYNGRFINIDYGYWVNGARYNVLEDTKSRLIYVSSKRNFDTFPLMDSNGKQYTYDEYISEYHK